MINKVISSQFQSQILSWYETHRRDLPWRYTRDPYHILVSEVMLQQTQVSRVIPKYLSWMERFPTTSALASAPVSEVLRYWSGLGYNRRALYLQKAAQAIEEKGEWPKSVLELGKLPGIGPYTARAVACFAFNEQVAVVDTNVRKVILHHFGEEDSGRPRRVKLCGVRQARMTEKVVEEIATQLLPQGKAYEWNQALMDYASEELKTVKIKIPKQSHFLTSDRYFRGQVIKILLTQERITLLELLAVFQKQGREISKERVEDILGKMAKDQLIVRTRGQITLPT